MFFLVVELFVWNGLFCHFCSHLCHFCSHLCGIQGSWNSLLCIIFCNGFFSLVLFSYLKRFLGRLRGLAVACWMTYHYYPGSNPSVGIFEGCFIIDFASLPLEVARPIQPTMCTKVAVKHQLSSSSLSQKFWPVFTLGAVDFLTELRFR